MLQILNLLQLVLYIALLSLLGQAFLYLLAGARREGNVFYRLLKLIARPFTWTVRRLTPRQVADHHVPWVTFGLLVVLYAVVTFERADLCVTGQMLGQPGCR